MYLFLLIFFVTNFHTEDKFDDMVKIIFLCVFLIQLYYDENNLYIV